jgi:hypothetical protein
MEKTGMRLPEAAVEHSCTPTQTHREPGCNLHDLKSTQNASSRDCNDMKCVGDGYQLPFLGVTSVSTPECEQKGETASEHGTDEP